MLAHNFRHRIGFQVQQQTQSALTGVVTVAWVDATTSSGLKLDRVPAQCLPGAGKEMIQSGSKYAEADLRVTVRWFPDLDPSWRLVWDGKAYDITSVEPDMTGRRYYKLICKEGLSDGQ